MQGEKTKKIRSYSYCAYLGNTEHVILPCSQGT